LRVSNSVEGTTRLSLSEGRETAGEMEAGFQCARCGEWNETSLDESAGGHQRYVEDCQVWCKANVLRVAWDPEMEDFVISAALECGWLVTGS